MIAVAILECSENSDCTPMGCVCKIGYVGDGITCDSEWLASIVSFVNIVGYTLRGICIVEYMHCGVCIVVYIVV